ncbi:hypothetical protein CPB86DRAFT_728966 [Serendipita vermifera]|nr:hypothetical protein CPB86DRAFT_728966 [Serendipita vermifera]
MEHIPHYDPGSILPPAGGPSGGSGTAVAQRTPAQAPNPEMIQNIQNYLLSCSWIQNGELEPALDYWDYLVQMGVVSVDRGLSRFDALVGSDGNSHTCLYTPSIGATPCGYTNYRRHRVRAHIYSHFSYKPYRCGGACGKQYCPLAFADNILLSDHVRRVGKPRTRCDICGINVVPQNYRRHMQTAHGQDEEASTS